MSRYGMRPPTVDNGEARKLLLEALEHITDKPWDDRTQLFPQCLKMRNAHMMPSML